MRSRAGGGSQRDEREERDQPPEVKRRGRDLNPRRTQEPETVFETAAFDRSATPPRDAQGTRRQETVMFSFMPAASCPGTVQ